MNYFAFLVWLDNLKFHNLENLDLVLVIEQAKMQLDCHYSKEVAYKQILKVLTTIVNIDAYVQKIHYPALTAGMVCENMRKKSGRTQFEESYEIIYGMLKIVAALDNNSLPQLLNWCMTLGIFLQSLYPVLTL